jgi:N-acetylglucosaminyl-diphospho-decaprenol L-rhamnosyltransferase
MNHSAGRRFSAVIVNYNGGNNLSDCVRSVIQEGVAAAEIIIVDNGSRDDSLLALENNIPGTKVIRNPCNAGFARAVNQGLTVASGELVLLLNNDATLDPGSLQAFADAFDHIPLLAIAGGQLRYADGRLQNSIAPLPTLTSELIPRSWLKLIFPRRFQGNQVADAPIKVECVIGACLAVRRAFLPALGSMDEDYFFYFEEIDWCRRALRSGFQVYHVPAARAFHYQGKTANRFRNGSRIEYQRSHLIFYRKSNNSVLFAALSVLLTLQALFNAVLNTVSSIATIFLSKRFREKAYGYWHSLAWHMLGRPESWGLPEKCPHHYKYF